MSDGVGRISEAWSPAARIAALEARRRSYPGGGKLRSLGSRLSEPYRVSVPDLSALPEHERPKAEAASWAYNADAARHLSPHVRALRDAGDVEGAIKHVHETPPSAHSTRDLAELDGVLAVPGHRRASAERNRVQAEITRRRALVKHPNRRSLL